MGRDNVFYIIGFCLLVSLVCSVLVSSAAVGLKPLQQANEILDQQKKVLAVAGLIKDGEFISPEKVQDLFSKRIKSVVVDLDKDEIDASENPSTYNQQKAKSDPTKSKVAPKNSAGIQRVPNKALVYYVSKTEMSTDGKGFTLEQYIFPIEGKGLWSTLYGYIALSPTGNVIKGLTFYKHGETPGLGGEVDNPNWKALWKDRLVYGPKGSKAASWKEPKISVIKGTAGTPVDTPHKVDGLSGATITSKGVSNLIKFWLGDEGFGPFIRRVTANAS